MPKADDPEIKSWREQLIGFQRRATPFILSVRRPLIVVVQLCAMAAAYYLAFNLRFDFSIPRDQFEVFSGTLVPLLACRGTAFLFFRLYSGMWRYVTISDLVALLKGGLSGSALFVGLLFLWKGHGLGGIPRSVLILELLLSVLILIGIRLCIRIYRENLYRPMAKASARRILVVGAGNWAISLARFLLADPSLGVQLEGFLDDDKTKHGLRILGRPVLGGIDDLERLAGQTGYRPDFGGHAQCSLEKNKGGPRALPLDEDRLQGPAFARGNHRRASAFGPCGRSKAGPGHAPRCNFFPCPERINEKCGPKRKGGIGFRGGGKHRR